MTHQYVVPVAPGTESPWTAAPFGGQIKEGFVWGRDAWNDKASLMAILEAIESLLKSGFQPRQPVNLVSGADEEVGDAGGAARIAAQFKARGLMLDPVLDEGPLIVHGTAPGVSKPVALVELAEKGYLTVKLTAKGSGGHSSCGFQCSCSDCPTS
jgi:carboxypeptidase PM20D1